MEQQLKWLWLALFISSAAWLIYEWIGFTDRVSTGQIVLPSSQYNRQSQVPSLGNQQAKSDTDRPSLANARPENDVPSLVPQTNVQIKNTTTDSVVKVETDNFYVTLSLEGGNIIELFLKKYPISVHEKDSLIQLMQPSPVPYFMQSGLLSEQQPVDHHAVFSSDQDFYQTTLEQSTIEVPLYWQKDGIEVVKTFVFDRDSHEISIKQTIFNRTDTPWYGGRYIQLSRSVPDDDSNTFIYTYTGSAWWSEESGFKKIDFDEMASDSPTLEAKGGWLSMIQHYFLSAVIPDEEHDDSYYTRQSNQQYIIGAVSQKTVAVESQQQHEFTDRLFIGPKNQGELVQTHPDLDYAVDYGVFHILSAPLFWLLKQIHGLFGNWGVAIILITGLIKLAFFKLSEKSYRSMARLKLLGPRIKQLRERYSGDKQALNQKMMQIYKEEKVNPLGGCLPVLVQIPVFISLYWVLIESVELRQAPFILWIEDLAIADPFFVLPVLMGVTMFLQQRLNPAVADPVQQKVMQFLPVIFTVFFLFFPAGLVLYWVVNNVLSIAQQWYITRRMEQEKSRH